MKIFKLATVVLTLLISIVSCQKQDDILSGMSAGSLKKSASGDCLPLTVNGLFKKDSVLDNNSYADVQLDITAAGTFEIHTDTINGYSFSRTGGVNKGLRTIRLYAKGKPVTTGTNMFTVKYGTSVCTFSVVVGGITATPAMYNLGGSPGTCTPFVLSGNYAAGTPLTPATNTVVITVNVSVIGSYSINTTSVNGIIFSANGLFATTGPQNVTLRGSGTPVAGGTFPIVVNGSSDNCSFSLNFIGQSVYTLGGAGANCTGFVLSGSYIAGITLTSSNKAIIDVDVSVIGGYNISSTTVNGINFSITGIFTVTGPQTVTLNGTGTPVSALTSVFPVTGGSTTCSFSLTVSPTPASGYTLDCTGIVANGNYFVGTALGASNTIVLPVNVTSIGTYSISSLPAVNGISFSKTGIFTSTGIQSVTIPGTGIPAAAGPFSYTITGAGNSCMVSITAVTGIPGIYHCKIDGVYTDFTDRAEAKIDDFGTPYLYLNGYTGPPNGNTVPEFQIFINKNNGSPVGVGTYNENGFLLPNGYRIEIDYTVLNPDLSVTIWNTSSNILPPAHPPFTIIVTSITAARVIGTFSGQLTNTLQGSTILKTITEGVFNLPIQ